VVCYFSERIKDFKHCSFKVRATCRVVQRRMTKSEYTEKRLKRGTMRGTKFEIPAERRIEETSNWNRAGQARILQLFSLARNLYYLHYLPNDVRDRRGIVKS
jgi:hypothetical protein